MSLPPSLSSTLRLADRERRDDFRYTISWLRLAPSYTVIHLLIQSFRVRTSPSIYPDNTMHGILIAIGPNLRYAFREDVRRSSSQKGRKALAPSPITLIPSCSPLIIQTERRIETIQREKAERSSGRNRCKHDDHDSPCYPALPPPSLPSFLPSVVHCATACGISSPRLSPSLPLLSSRYPCPIR